MFARVDGPLPLSVVINDLRLYANEIRSKLAWNTGSRYFIREILLVMKRGNVCEPLMDFL